MQVQLHQCLARKAPSRQGTEPAVETIKRVVGLIVVILDPLFEASQRVVRSYDDMMDRAFSLLGEA